MFILWNTLIKSFQLMRIPALILLALLCSIQLSLKAQDLNGFRQLIYQPAKRKDITKPLTLQAADSVGLKMLSLDWCSGVQMPVSSDHQFIRLSEGRYDKILLTWSNISEELQSETSIPGNLKDKTTWVDAVLTGF